MDWNRKLTPEEMQRWDDVTMAVAVVGMLSIVFMAAAVSDFEKMDKTPKQPDNTEIKSEEEGDALKLTNV
jgi:hypothetical protein